MITCGCGCYGRKYAVGVNQYHFSEIDGGPKACQRCVVFVLLCTKELEFGLRNSGNVHFFFLSDDCRQLETHKTGRGGTRNKFSEVFYVCSGSTSRVYGSSIKRNQGCEIYKVLHSK